MCDCSATRPEFSRHEKPIARKEHQCLECGDQIPKGTQYEYYVGKQYGGDFWGAKLCLQCDEDWVTLCGVEDEANPSGIWDRVICFGCPRERIEAAFEEEWIDKDHPLAKRWIAADLLQESSEEDDEDGVLVGKDNPLQIPLFI